MDTESTSVQGRWLVFIACVLASLLNEVSIRVVSLLPEEVGGVKPCAF